MWNKAFVLGVCVSILLISSIASAQELQDYNGDCVADIKDIVIKETHRQGDVNWDGKVDIKDLVTLAMNFHKTSEDLDWDPRWDVANDVGIVNVKDLAVVAQGIQIRSLGTPLSGTAIVYVDPPSSNVVKGQNFTINVSIDTVDPLYGYQVYVYFNTSVISGVEVTSGPFLGGGFFGNGIDNTTGIILIYDSKIGEVPGTSGSGVLAIVTFHADNYGESYLNLEDVKLIDENVTEIASTQENGTVKTYTPVTGCMDINASGTYLLENDVSTSSSQRCMNITASDVVLDCQGHKIDGLGSMSSGSGIYAGSSSARLNNVVISNSAAHAARQGNGQR